MPTAAPALPMTPPPLKIACLGECMIELRPHAPGLLAQGFAGDTYNTAVYLKRLDRDGRISVHYATGLGVDSFADDMLESWRAEGIESDLARRVPGHNTGLYSIRTDARGERQFSYWREHSAARAYFDAGPTPLEEAAGSIDVLYLSGISLAVMASALPERLPALLARVQTHGGRVVFDNNYRPRLWGNVEAARAAFALLYARCDIAFVTLDDAAALEPGPDDDAVLARVLALPCPEVVVKRGALPTLVRLAGHAPVEVPVEVVSNPIDTTAAGDSFAAGYLAQRLAGASPEAAAALGNGLAGVVIRHPGAIIGRAAMAEFIADAGAEAAR
jgi:2-dehydro-3-deoxygluconokinase